MKQKTLIAILLILDYVLLLSQMTTQGSTVADNVDADNSDITGTIYSSTVGAIGALLSAQTYSANQMALTAQCEGCVLTAYMDSGTYSIGYGHKPASAGETITQQQANDYLASDLASAAAFVLSMAQVPLGQNQLDALTDWVYNLGSGKVANATLWQVLNSGNYAGVPAQLVRWCYAGGVQNSALLARRQQEANTWNTPDGSN